MFSNIKSDYFVCVRGIKMLSWFYISTWEQWQISFSKTNELYFQKALFHVELICSEALIVVLFSCLFVFFFPFSFLKWSDTIPKFINSKTSKMVSHSQIHNALYASICITSFKWLGLGWSLHLYILLQIYWPNPSTSSMLIPILAHISGCVFSKIHVYAWTSHTNESLKHSHSYAAEHSTLIVLTTTLLCCVEVCFGCVCFDHTTEMCYIHHWCASFELPPSVNNSEWC